MDRRARHRGDDASRRVRSLYRAHEYALIVTEGPTTEYGVIGGSVEDLLFLWMSAEAIVHE